MITDMITDTHMITCPMSIQDNQKTNHFRVFTLFCSSSSFSSIIVISSVVVVVVVVTSSTVLMSENTELQYMQ